MREILIEKNNIDDLEKHKEFILLRYRANIKVLSVLSADKFKYTIDNKFYKDTLYFVQFLDFNLGPDCFNAYNSQSEPINLIHFNILKKNILSMFFTLHDEDYKFLNEEFVAEIIFDGFKQIANELKGASHFQVLNILNVGAERIIAKLN